MMPRGSYRLGPFAKNRRSYTEGTDGAFMPDSGHHSRKGRARRPHGIGKPNAV